MERFGAFAGALGITRLANVTGLDYVGIPVFMAIRPNSRSLSVSQGKGLDNASAAASAFMEATELAHAEQIVLQPRVESYSALKSRARVADPALLPRVKRTSLATDPIISWVEGMDLADRLPIFVPFDLVHVGFDRPKRSGEMLFFRSSNGLASGNHWLEALCAGICETIERDATSLWDYRSTEQRADRRVALGSVRDPDCRAVLDRLEDRDMAVAVWDTTTDIDVASFLCRIKEALGNERSALGAFWGAGCHLSREVALTRAITEAAQSRLTYIVGSRDDLSHSDYERAEGQELFDLVQDDWEKSKARHEFKNVPSNAAATFESDLARLLMRLREAGLPRVIAVDLTDDRYGIPVVRIIIPGLETHDEYHRHKPGRRARALARSLQ